MIPINQLPKRDQKKIYDNLDNKSKVIGCEIFGDEIEVTFLDIDNKAKRFKVKRYNTPEVTKRIKTPIKSIHCFIDSYNEIRLTHEKCEKFDRFMKNFKYIGEIDIKREDEKNEKAKMA